MAFNLCLADGLQWVFLSGMDGSFEFTAVCFCRIFSSLNVVIGRLRHLIMVANVHAIHNGIYCDNLLYYVAKCTIDSYALTNYDK